MQTGTGRAAIYQKSKFLITAVSTYSTYVFQKLGATYIQENSSFLTAAKSLAEELPEKREAILRDLSMREYLLKLPVTGGSDIGP